MRRGEVRRKARELGVIVSWHTNLEGRLSVRRSDSRERVLVDTPREAWSEAQRLAQKG